MNDEDRSLARSAFHVVSLFETVVLEHEDDRDPVEIGEFYGDRWCAAISPSEAWCAVGGCGLILYFLREPFDEYRYGLETAQWREFGREPADPWWITSVAALADITVLFTVDDDTPGGGTYQLDLQSWSAVTQL